MISSILEDLNKPGIHFDVSSGRLGYEPNKINAQEMCKKAKM